MLFDAPIICLLGAAYLLLSTRETPKSDHRFTVGMMLSVSGVLLGMTIILV